MAAPGGGSTDKLNNSEVAKKLAKYYAQVEQRAPAPTESVDFLKTRNDVIHEQKHIPHRDRTRDLMADYTKKQK